MNETFDPQVRSGESVWMDVLGPVRCMVVWSNALRDVFPWWRTYLGQWQWNVTATGIGTGSTFTVSATLPPHRLHKPHAALLAPATASKALLQKYSGNHCLYKAPALMLKMDVNFLPWNSSSITQQVYTTVDSEELKLTSTLCCCLPKMIAEFRYLCHRPTWLLLWYNPWGRLHILNSACCFRACHIDSNAHCVFARKRILCYYMKIFS